MLCDSELMAKHSQQLTSREYEADEWRRELNHVADFEAWDRSLAWEWNNTVLFRPSVHVMRHKPLWTEHLGNCHRSHSVKRDFLH